LNQKTPIEPKIQEGLVIKTTGSWYVVQTGRGQTVRCKLKGRLRQAGYKSTNPIVVGDQVGFQFDKEHQVGVIDSIFERRNFIVRKASKLSKQSQIIAANIDQAILMVTLVAPRTHVEFIDRFLVSAEAYRIPAFLFINKMDMYDAELTKKADALAEIYRKVGYPCFEMSVKTGRNMETIKPLLRNKVSLLSGNSGVGKSTLINSLAPGLNLKTATVSDFHKTGRHTTTFVEMHPIEQGGHVIDTPGIKGFGLVHIEKDELYHFFPEIFSFSKHCKFYNCKHVNEPGCAVIEAVREDQISASRYQNYLMMYMDEDQKYRI
jgi:ribosome biogenesis GTPase